MPATANNEPLPTKSVFLAALIPALLGVFSGLFILPTQISPDPAAGLLTWLHFTNGGTWNTVPLPDPNNISQTIEVAVTWWPPGQYLFLGLLNSAGLSFGHAAVLLAFFSTLSGAIGLAFLGKELGAPARSLPWIAAALACSQYNLTNYNTFSGGEVLIMAFWPWVALAGWKIRHNDRLIIYILPILFTAGSFIKYSFAVYAICIILFLWSERLVTLDLKKHIRLWKKVISITKTSIPLAVAGIIYIIERHYLTENNNTPLQDWAGSYSLKEVIGYTPISSLTSMASLKVPLISLISQLLHRDYHEAWLQTAAILTYASPIIIISYIILATKENPLLRFLGITSLTTTIIFSSFYILGYAVSLQDRYYQQAGALFLVAIAAYAFKGRRLSRLAHILIIIFITSGVFKFSKSTYINSIYQHPKYIKEIGLSSYLNKNVIEKAISVTTGYRNSIIAVPYQEMALGLTPFRHPSTCLFFTHSLTFKPTLSYKGRVSQITVIEPTWDQRNLKSRFIDYAEDEWTSYEIDGWTFWQTGYSEKVETQSSVEAH